MRRSQEVLQLPEWMNADRARNIALYRSLGYSQAEIGEELSISQQTVSRYLAGLRKTAEDAEGTDDLQKLFIGLIIGGFSVALLAYFLTKK